MKKSFLIFVIFSFICVITKAQNGPLKGSGKAITKEFSINGFDKISFEDFDGKIEVEIGKPFSIKIEIDDNLEQRLIVNKKEETLIVKLSDNYNGKLYLENTHIKIKVTMPEASVIDHRGNTIVKVTGIVGRYFRFENAGNGNVYLSGKTEELDIKKTGNGSIDAKNLITNTAKVKSFGNGNVSVNAQIILTANGAGNCSVMQFGQGKIESMSGIIGNGEVKKM